MFKIQKWIIGLSRLESTVHQSHNFSSLQQQLTVPKSTCLKALYLLFFPLLTRVTSEVQVENKFFQCQEEEVLDLK